MGSCLSISSSEIHRTQYDSEIVVYSQDNHYTDDVHGGIGSIFSCQGSKKINQDAAIIYQGYIGKDGAFYGVFDGHGINGQHISKLVRNKLPLFLMNQINAAKQVSSTEICNDKSESESKIETFEMKDFNEWKEACVNAFKVMDKEIKLLENVDTTCSGTTAVVIIKQGEHLIIANLGDSRAIMGTKSQNGIISVPLTIDHKPGLSCEADRIKKCNGRVIALKEEPHIKRLWLPNDNSAGLAMSRAFGDFLLKNNGLISIPHVSYHHISPNDRFLVLATDGVWDVLSNDEVVKIVSSAASETAAAKALIEASIIAWKRKFPNLRRDDSTAICLFFQHK